MADLELEKLGRYEIVRELGRGAMGVVYEGYDPIVGRRVAVKTARRDVIESSTRADELMERFLREARAAGALSHPNIVTIYDAGEENGVAYIAMEFLDGTDLQKLLEQNRRFPVDRVLEITSTLCAALSHAHANGIIHRDIKPANVVVLESGLIKVADFGIAHISNSQLTQEGSVIGTPHYMSPEQFMGHAIDERSDLFSAGVIVYEMLTGEKPFHGNSLSAVMHSVLNVLPVPPRQLNFAVSDCLSRVVMKALSKDRRARYQSADDMCRALKECLNDCPDRVVLQVDLPETSVGLSETIQTGGDTQTLATAPFEAATQVLDTPAVGTVAPAHIASAQEAGWLMRQQRIERGKSMEQVYADCRVPERYLIALEEGDLSAFEDDEWNHVADCVRAFCTALDLEPTPYLEAFELAYTEALRPSRKRMPRRAFLVGVGSLLALLLAAWGGYTWLVDAPKAILLAQDQLPPNPDYYQVFDFDVRIFAPDEVEDPPAGDFKAEFRAVQSNGKEYVTRETLVNQGRLYVYDRNLRDLKLYVYKTGFGDSDQDLTLRAPDDLKRRDTKNYLKIDLSPKEPV